IRPGPGRRVLLGAGAAVLILLALIGVLLLRGGNPPRHTTRGAPTSTPTASVPSTPSTPPTLTSSPMPAEPNSILRLDAGTGAPVADILVGQNPHGVAFSGGYLWVVNRSAHTISRIDPDTDDVVSTVGGMTGPCDIAPDPGGGVWVANCLAKPHEVDRINPESGQVEQRVHVPDVPAGVAFGAGDLWVALLPALHPPGTVLRIDPDTPKVVHTFHVGKGAEYVAFGD